LALAFQEAATIPVAFLTADYALNGDAIHLCASFPHRYITLPAQSGGGGALRKRRLRAERLDPAGD
jgi:hypothetical protein